MKNLYSKIISVCLSAVLTVGLISGAVPVINPEVEAAPTTNTIRWNVNTIKLISKYDYTTDTHTNVAENNVDRGITATAPETNSSFSWVDWQGRRIQTGPTGGDLRFSADEGKVITEIAIEWDTTINVCDIPDGWTYMANYENQAGDVGNYLVWNGTPTRTVGMDFTRTAEEPDEPGYDLTIGYIYFTIGILRDSGSCGNDANWALDYSGNLVISGTGPMSWSGTTPPWSAYMADIATVEIESGITTIGNSAFKDCDNLTDVTIPDTVTNIYPSAFRDCEALTSMVIPGSVETIGNMALAYCWKLENLTIGQGVKTIEQSAFYGCDGLDQVVLPDSVTFIGPSAFGSCDNISSLTLGSGITTIPSYCFSSCRNLEEVTIPEGVTTIDEGAFLNCFALSSVTFPEGLTSVGTSAFANDALQSVILPRNLATLGRSAFAYNSDLTFVVVSRELFDESSIAFEECPDAIIHYYYDITYANDGNGTITGNEYSYGTATEEFTITPKNGFELAYITWSNGDVSEILYADDDGLYTMPDSESDVTITAEFYCPAVDEVIARIEDLPGADDVTLNNKEDIEAARSAYDDLPTDLKDLIPEDYVNRLEEAEAALRALELEKAKEDAVAELNNLLKSKNESDYEPSDWADLTKAINDAITAINSATTTDEVDKIKNAAIETVNSIPTKADAEEEESEDPEEEAPVAPVDTSDSTTPAIAPVNDGQPANDEGNNASASNNLAQQYYIASGGQATWTKGSGVAFILTIKMEGPEDTSFDHFLTTGLDERILRIENECTVGRGSTIITINPSVLEQLSVGEHTITVTFDNGSVSTMLTIKDAPADSAVTSTGEAEGTAVLYGTACIIAAAALFAVNLVMKKRYAGNR